MKRSVLFLAALFLSGVLAAQATQTIPELFQTAKQQIKASAWQDARRTLDALDAESAKPGNEGVRAQLEGPVAFYRGVCDANLGEAEKAQAEFAAFLQGNPNATMDPAMYSKKAVAAFEAARKNAAPPPGPDAAPSLFTAYQEFKAPANLGEPPDERWGEGPIRWLMTSADKRVWSELAAGAERVEFIDKFWEARNPRPGTSDNTFRTTFERRVAFADTNFVQDEKRRGSVTDRGMVFVLLGPPTYAGRKPIRTGEDVSDSAGLSTEGSHDAANAQRALGSGGVKQSTATRATASAQFGGPGTRAVDAGNNWREVWHYRKELLPKGAPYQQVDVEFITKKGYGVNVMQREPQVLNTLDAAKKKLPS